MLDEVQGRLRRLRLNNLPAHVQKVVGSFQGTTMRPVLVGGCVRDACLDRACHEYDVEVFGVNCIDDLASHLSQCCRSVSYVGQSFGVFKVGADIEIAVPRRDRKVGTKHTDFEVDILEPHVSYAQASQRRDLTMNSMGYDPINEEFYDPYHGLEAMRCKRLSCVDETTFGEDPLRPWRVLQFASRFYMEPDAVVLRLSQELVMDIAPERVYAELKKWLCYPNDLQRGWDFFIQAQLGRYCPMAWPHWRQRNIQEKIRAGFSVLQDCPLDKDAMMTMGLLIMTWDCSAVDDLLRFLCAPVVMQRRIMILHQLWRCWLREQTLNYDVVCILLRVESLKVCDAVLWVLARSVDGRAEVVEKWGACMSMWFECKREVSRPVVQGRDLCAAGMVSGPHFSAILHQCHRIQIEEGICERDALIQRVRTERGDV